MEQAEEIHHFDAREVADHEAQMEYAAELVASANWYHGWEIIPGVHTPGRCKVDPKAVLDFYGVPEDLTGKRALDIGAWDGAYSFELERRGAEVVSLDVQDPDKNGFNIAKRILGSKVEHVQDSVYDLGWTSLTARDEDVTGPPQFDLILYMGVFYHLKDPMYAFGRIKTVMKPNAILYFEGMVFDYAWKSEVRLLHRRAEIEAIRDLPIAYFATEEYGYDDENWYVPTVTCLYGWMLAAGFDVRRMAVVGDTSRAYGVAKING